MNIMHEERELAALCKGKFKSCRFGTSYIASEMSSDIRVRKDITSGSHSASFTK
jgi:hypothetical protein